MEVPQKLQSIGAATSAQEKTILIVGSRGKPLQRIRRELRATGYLIREANGSQQALQLLSSKAISLVILVTAENSKNLDEGKIGRTGRPPLVPPIQTNQNISEFALRFQSVKNLAGSRGIPVLLISSFWSDSALTNALASGAENFLFAPYQASDLSRAIRTSLLNGPMQESEGDSDEVAVIHEDRTHRLRAGKSRLARLTFSLFEDLRQCRATLSWSRAEAQDLRRQLRQERRHVRLAHRSPAVVQGIAHDFSNLLETVSAAATVLRSRPAQPKPYRDAMDAALSQASGLLATLQNWSEWEAEEVLPSGETVSLQPIAREVLDAALLPLRAPNIRVRLQLDDLPPVSASRLLMMRVLSNLVWNAVDAMPDGGRLSFLGYLQRNRVVVEVSDTGVGISKSNQEKIFLSPHSTKSGHSGMGLLLVQRLIREAKGDITFVSHPGRGSTFALSFPAADARTETPASSREGRDRLVIR